MSQSESKLRMKVSLLRGFEEGFEEDKDDGSDFIVQQPLQVSKKGIGSLSDDQSIFAELEKEFHKNFTQVCPPENYKKSDKCSICKNQFSSLLNSAKNCQFCGRCVCKDCSKRTRKDPQNPEIVIRTCELCHLQLLYKRIVESFQGQKIEKEKQRNEANDQCELKKAELYKKQKINEEIKLQSQTQKIKYEQQIDQKKQKLQEQKDIQCKRLVEVSGLKDKIIKHQEERVTQEKELAKLRQNLYELTERKKVLEKTSLEKEKEFERLKNKYSSIQNYIDKRKIQSQSQEISELLGPQKNMSALRYQASIIDYNHVNSSLNSAPISNSASKQQNKDANGTTNSSSSANKRVRDEKLSTGWCTKNDACKIF